MSSSTEQAAATETELGLAAWSGGWGRAAWRPSSTPPADELEVLR